MSPNAHRPKENHGEEHPVRLSGWVLFWGILALVVGVVSGLVMSTATFIR